MGMPEAKLVRTVFRSVSAAATTERLGTLRLSKSRTLLAVRPCRRRATDTSPSAAAQIPPEFEFSDCMVAKVITALSSE